MVDLRCNSKTYGMYATFSLSSVNAKMIYVPKGLAHGFCTLSDNATLVYKTSTVYNAQFDSGILWSSAGIPWPCDQPIVSKRDTVQIPMSEFKSPFLFK